MVKFLDNLLTFLLAITFMFSLTIASSMFVKQFTTQYEDTFKLNTKFLVVDKL